MSETLKPCPFCGTTGTDEVGLTGYYVTCENPDCAVQPEARGITAADARRIWNTRAAQSRQADDLRRQLAEAQQRLSAPCYLIEKPQPGGVYWWSAGLGADVFELSEEHRGWTRFFTDDPHKAIRLHSRQAAEALLYHAARRAMSDMLDSADRLTLVVTEHVFLEGVAS